MREDAKIIRPKYVGSKVETSFFFEDNETFLKRRNIYSLDKLENE